MQVIAILIIVVGAFLFVKYVLCDGDLTEGIKRTAYAGSFVILVVVGWIAIAAFIIFVIYAALGGFNR